MKLPAEIYVVLVNFPNMGIGNANDPVTTLDDAADLVGQYAQYETRALRITDMLTVTDVTDDCNAVIAARMAERAA